MKKKLSILMSIVLAVVSCGAVFQMKTPITAEAAVAEKAVSEGEYEIIYNNDRVIVSLGDSFSSGEGIEPFFDDDIPSGVYHELTLYSGDSYTYVDKNRTYDLLLSKDWLCHRSENAWSGMLKLKDYSTGKSITMNQNRGTGSKSGNWYFAAMSGAVTGNILDTGTIPDDVKAKAKKGKKLPEEYEHRFKLFNRTVAIRFINGKILPERHKEYVEIEPQLNVFKQLKNKKAEYVTITMGGNDVEFADVIKDAVLDFDFLEFTGYRSRLDKHIDKIKENLIDTTVERLEQCYKKISETAGSQAHIIVAGYPKLVAPYTTDIDSLIMGSLMPRQQEYFTSNKSIVFSQKDAQSLDEAVKIFNDRIYKAVEKCQKEGMNISFVSVYNAFGNDVAYSSRDKDKELLNRLQSPNKYDIDETKPTSSYSIHPNLKGAEVYAECVQDEIDKNEKKLTVSGKITDIDGKELEGVEITVETVGQTNGQKVSSKKDGQFFTQSYWESEYGTAYNITFEKEGYSPLIITEKTDGKKGNNLTINVKLVPELFDVEITGTVTEKNGDPIDGAEVTVIGGYKTTKEIKTVIVDGKEKQEEFIKADRTQQDKQTVYTENGKYSVRLVSDKPDNYQITVQKKDYEPYENKNIRAERPDPPDKEVSVTHDVKLGRHRYQLFSDMAYTWTQAESYCESLGGHLATISSAEEMQDIISEIQNTDDPSNCYWIGLRGEGFTWEWVTGEPVTYFNWAEGEPNNYWGQSENYVHLFGRKYTGGFGIKTVGSWNDTSDSGAAYAGDFYSLNNMGFICEWDE